MATLGSLREREKESWVGDCLVHGAPVLLIAGGFKGEKFEDGAWSVLLQLL